MKRRLLSLFLIFALAAVMATGAGAANYDKFPDAAEAAASPYARAIDVVVGLGIIEGDTTYGSAPELNLDGPILRGQMAKIVAYMVLGAEEAEKLPAPTEDVFDDVPANHWAAPYIAYGVECGYFAGHGDGTFTPDEPMTGHQFGKVLLNVLGYGLSLPDDFVMPEEEPAPAEAPPAMPEGEAPPAMPEGEAPPAMPEGGTPPAMPEGGTPPAMPEGGGAPPAMPGGEAPPAPPEGGGAPPDMPPGGMMPNALPAAVASFVENDLTGDGWEERVEALLESSGVGDGLVTISLYEPLQRAAAMLMTFNATTGWSRAANINGILSALAASYQVTTVRNPDGTVTYNVGAELDEAGNVVNPGTPVEGTDTYDEAGNPVGGTQAGGEAPPAPPEAGGAAAGGGSTSSGTSSGVINVSGGGSSSSGSSSQETVYTNAYYYTYVGEQDNPTSFIIATSGGEVVTLTKGTHYAAYEAAVGVETIADVTVPASASGELAIASPASGTATSAAFGSVYTLEDDTSVIIGFKTGDGEEVACANGCSIVLLSVGDAGLEAELIELATIDDNITAGDGLLFIKEGDYATVVYVLKDGINRG